MFHFSIHPLKTFISVNSIGGFGGFLVKSNGSHIGRMSFTCPPSLKKRIKDVSEKEGISMSSKIVELLNIALSLEESNVSKPYELEELERNLNILQEEVTEQKRINAIFEEKIDLLRYEMARINSYQQISNSNLN